MSDKKDKKNIFEKIGDAFSSKDEKEAEQKALEEAEAAKKAETEEKVAEIKADLARQKAAADAKKKAADAEEKRLAEEAAAKKKADEAAAQKRSDEIADRRKEQVEQVKEQAESRAQQAENARKEAMEAAPAPTLAKYTIKPGDTLSEISQKHYGHATRDYWMTIYEANKVVIGDNPGMIKPGVELTIPELPDRLKG